MKKFIYIFSAAALALLAFNACMKEDIETCIVGDVISFSIDLSQYWNNNGSDDQTKSDESSLGETKGYLLYDKNLGSSAKQIGVIGYLEDTQNNYVSNTDGFVQSETLTYKSSSKKWLPANTYYWPKTQALNFFAWAPADTIKNAGGREIVDKYKKYVKISNFTVTNSDDVHTISFGYDLRSSDSEKQPDLLFASRLGEKRTDTTSPESVKLGFKHALSAVQFKIKSKQGGYLSTITLGSVAKTGECTFDGATSQFSWTNTSTGSFYHNFKTTLPPDTYVSLCSSTAKPTFLMIPQILDGKTKTISIKIAAENASGVTPVTYTGKIPAGSWEAGKKYVYTIDIDEPAIKIKVSVEDWSPVSGGTMTFNGSATN